MFYRCTNCNELRAPSYSYCPGCYAATNGCVPSSRPYVDETVIARPRMSFSTGVAHMPRPRLRFDAVALLLIVGLFLLSRHPQVVDNVVQQIYYHNTYNTKIAQLCMLDEQAQAENTYPSELRYLDSWIAAIANGDVHHRAYSEAVNTIDVTIPKEISPQKARGRASFYRVMFVSMRKQYLPQTDAGICSVTIYDKAGRPIAKAGNETMQN